MKTFRTTIHIVTAENIDKESYYNCVQLSRITGYANPIGAIKTLTREGHQTEWKVEKDKCGNIVKAA